MLFGRSILGTSHLVHEPLDGKRGRNLDMHLNKIRDESKLKREWMKMGLHGETKLSQGSKERPCPPAPDME